MRFFHEIICRNSPGNNKKELKNLTLQLFLKCLLMRKKYSYIYHMKQKFLCLIISFITSLHIVPIHWSHSSNINKNILINYNTLNVSLSHLNKRIIKTIRHSTRGQEYSSLIVFIRKRLYSRTNGFVEAAYEFRFRWFQLPYVDFVFLCFSCRKFLHRKFLHLLSENI